MHINSFGIENFRVFNKFTEIKLSPITILVGPNNSGKSTISKAMLLIKSSIKNGKLYSLDVLNQDLSLLSFNALKNCHSENDMVKFSWSYNEGIISDPDSDEIDGYNNFETKISYKNNLAESFDIKMNDELIVSTMKIQHEKQTNENGQGYWVNPNVYYTFSSTFFGIKQIFLKNKILEEFEFLGNESFEKITDSIKYYIENAAVGISFSDTCDTLTNYEHFINSFYQDWIESFLSYNNDFDEYGSDLYHALGAILEVNLSNILPKEFFKKVPQKIVELKLFQLINFAKTEFYHRHIDVTNCFGNIRFISKIRSRHEIVYKQSEYPILVKNLLDLKKQIDILGNKNINDSYNDNLIFLNKWLVEEFQQLDNLKDLKIDYIEGFGVNISFGKIQSSQLGYGIVQLLPILLQVTFESHKIFIIEEPESNLHPAFQSKLADFFAQAYKKFGHQFIIETHSEYLVRKLQFLTAQNKLSTNNTIIHYFNHQSKQNDTESQVKTIHIEKDGSLSSDFGTGFFDVADSIAIDLFLLKINQRN